MHRATEWIIEKAQAGNVVVRAVRIAGEQIGTTHSALCMVLPHQQQRKVVTVDFGFQDYIKRDAAVFGDVVPDISICEIAPARAIVERWVRHTPRWQVEQLRVGVLGRLPGANTSLVRPYHSMLIPLYATALGWMSAATHDARIKKKEGDKLAQLETVRATIDDLLRTFQCELWKAEQAHATWPSL